MKVRELITVLQKVDPDHEVIVGTRREIVPILGICVGMVQRNKEKPSEILSIFALNPEGDPESWEIQEAIRQHNYVEDAVSLEWNPDSKMPLVE
jgi:hypothetical protein